MNLRGAAIALVVALLLPSPALSNDWVSLHEAFYKAHLNDVAVDNPVVFAILNAAMVDGEATARYLGSQQSANDFANLLREIGAYGVTVPIGVEVRGSTGLEFLGNGVTGQATAGIRVDMLRALGRAVERYGESWNQEILDLLNDNPEDYRSVINETYRLLTEDGSNSDAAVFQANFRRLQSTNPRLLGVDSDVDTLALAVPDGLQAAYGRGQWLSLSPEEREQALANPQLFFELVDPGVEGLTSSVRAVRETVNDVTSLVEELGYQLSQEGRVQQAEIERQLDSLRFVATQQAEANVITHLRLEEIQETLDQTAFAVGQIVRGQAVDRALLRNISRTIDEVLSISESLQIDLAHVRVGVDFLVKDRLRQIALERRAADIAYARAAIAFSTSVVAYALPGADQETLARFVNVGNSVVTIADIASRSIVDGVWTASSTLGTAGAALAILQAFSSSQRGDPFAEAVLENQRKILEVVMKSFELQKITYFSVAAIEQSLLRLQRDQSVHFSIVQSELEALREGQLDSFRLVEEVARRAEMNRVVSEYYLPIRDILTGSDGDLRQEIASGGAASPIRTSYQLARGTITAFGTTTSASPPFVSHPAFEGDGLAVLLSQAYEDRVGSLPAMAEWLNGRLALEPSDSQEASKVDGWTPIDTSLLWNLVHPKYWLLAVSWFMDLTTRAPVVASGSEDLRAQQLCSAGCAVHAASQELRRFLPSIYAVYVDSEKTLAAELESMISTWEEGWNRVHELDIGRAAELAVSARAVMEFLENPEITWDQMKHIRGRLAADSSGTKVLGLLLVDAIKLEDFDSVVELLIGMNMLEPVTEAHLYDVSVLQTGKGGYQIHYSGCVSETFGYRWTEAAVALLPTLNAARQESITERGFAVELSSGEQYCFIYDPLKYTETESGTITPAEWYWIEELELADKSSGRLAEAFLEQGREGRGSRIIETTSSYSKFRSPDGAVLVGTLNQVLAMARSDLWAGLTSSGALPELADELTRASITFETAAYYGYGSCIYTNSTLGRSLFGFAPSAGLEPVEATTDLEGLSIPSILTGMPVREALRVHSAAEFAASLMHYLSSLNASSSRRPSSLSTGFDGHDLEALAECPYGPPSVLTGLSVLHEVGSLFDDILPAGCIPPNLVQSLPARGSSLEASQAPAGH